jgi:GTP pyrophosphokinase
LALAKVFEIHREQERKGSRVPYLGHLLATAGSVLHFGGSQDQAIGALLHDAGEDGGGRVRVEEIRELFGPDVADIVEGCSDTLESEKPAWRERKEKYIASLAHKDPRILFVSAADKLDNARAIVADLRQLGLAALERFNPESDQPWYYRQLVNAFRARGIGPIVEELEVVVTEMERLAMTAGPSDDLRV